MKQSDLDEMKKINWWHRIPLTAEVTTPGQCGHGTGEDADVRFGLPKNLAGKMVLDIGCWDGLFSFEAEKRGAQVLATDIYQGAGTSNDGFQFAKRILNSNVQYKSISVMDINDDLGKFDVVLFYGVLYHLQDPKKALENACSVTKDIILIETAVEANRSKEPLLTYKPGQGNDPFNYYYPNFEWIKQELIQHGFTKVEQIFDMGSRITVRAER